MKFRDGSQYVTTQRTSKQIKLAVVVAIILIGISLTGLAGKLLWETTEAGLAQGSEGWIYLGLAGFALWTAATIQRWWNHS